MQKLLVVMAAAFAARSAWAQPRISPRLERWGGSAYVFVFRPGADMDRARVELRERGFDLIDHPDLRPRDILAAGPRARLERLGNWEDIAHVLPASQNLVTRQRVIACSGPIVEEDGAAAAYVQVGRGWSRDASGYAVLRYVFESMTEKVETGAAKAEIERAFREWEKYARVILTPAADPNGGRTIAIRFAEGNHGDLYPFDGPARSLAHTFYPAPPNPEPIAGNMHFDAAENWRIGAGLDLYSVALHEAGHALGLAHSDDPSAVMYPYYHQAYGLTSDDIAGIQSLYGARGNTPPPPAQPPALPPLSSPPPQQPPTAADRTPPTLRITSPSGTIIATTAASLTLTGTASDDTGVAAVRWTTSTGGSGAAAGTTNWSAAIPLYIGTTVVAVRAYDGAGNSAWRAITVTRR